MPCHILLTALTLVSSMARLSFTAGAQQAPTSNGGQNLGTLIEAPHVLRGKIVSLTKEEILGSSMNQQRSQVSYFEEYSTHLEYRSTIVVDSYDREPVATGKTMEPDKVSYTWYHNFDLKRLNRPPNQQCQQSSVQDFYRHVYGVNQIEIENYMSQADEVTQTGRRVIVGTPDTYLRLFAKQSNKLQLVLGPHDKVNLARNIPVTVYLGTLEVDVANGVSGNGTERRKLLMVACITVEDHTKIERAKDASLLAKMLPVRLKVVYNNDQVTLALTFDYYSIEPLDMDQLYDGRTGLDKLSIPAGFGCSLWMSNADPRDTTRRMYGYRAGLEHFSFKGHLRDARDKLRQFDIRVTYDGLGNVFRRDLINQGSQQRQIVTTIYDMFSLNKYHLVSSGAALLEELVDGDRPLLTANQRDHLRRRRCVTKSMTSDEAQAFVNFHSIMGSRDAILLGYAKVQDIECSVYEARLENWPIWRESFHIVSGLGHPAGMEDQDGAFGEANDENDQAQIDRYIVFYEAKADDMLGHLIKIQLIEVYRRLYVRSQIDIDLFQFEWQATRGTEEPDEVFDVSDCVNNEANKITVELMLRLVRPGLGFGNEKQLVKPFSNRRVRNEALVRMLHETYHVPRPHIAKLESRMMDEFDDDVIYMSAELSDLPDTDYQVELIGSGYKNLNGLMELINMESELEMIDSEEECMWQAAHRTDLIKFAWCGQDTSRFCAMDTRSDPWPSNEPLVVASKTSNECKLYRIERSERYNRYQMPNGLTYSTNLVRNRLLHLDQSKLTIYFKQAYKRWQASNKEHYFEFSKFYTVEKSKIRMPDIAATSRVLSGYRYIEENSNYLLPRRQSDSQDQEARGAESDQDGSSEEDIIPMIADQVSLDACYMACLHDVDCQSFSFCPRGLAKRTNARLNSECVASKKYLTSDTINHITNVGLKNQTNRVQEVTDSSKTKELILEEILTKDSECNIYGKNSVKMFHKDNKQISIKLTTDEQSIAEDVEQCAKSCLDEALTNPNSNCRKFLFCQDNSCIKGSLMNLIADNYTETSESKEVKICQKYELNLEFMYTPTQGIAIRAGKHTNHVLDTDHSLSCANECYNLALENGKQICKSFDVILTSSKQIICQLNDLSIKDLLRNGSGDQVVHSNATTKFWHYEPNQLLVNTFHYSTRWQDADSNVKKAFSSLDIILNSMLMSTVIAVGILTGKKAIKYYLAGWTRNDDHDSIINNVDAAGPTNDL